MDPLIVMQDPDIFNWLVRVAAHNFVIRKENEAARKRNQ
jgi:hypothetical protein